MAGEVNSPPPGTITVNLNQVEDAGLTRADFKSEVDYTKYLDAVETAKQERQSGVGNPRLTIPAPLDPDALKSGADKFQFAASLVGDSMMEVMRMLHEVGVQDKATGKLQRKMEQKSQVEEILKGADDIRKAGLMNALSTAVGGLVKIAGAAVSFTGTVKAAKVQAGTTSGDLKGPLSGLNDKVGYLKGQHEVTGMGSGGTVTTRPTPAQQQMNFTQAQNTLQKWSMGAAFIEGTVAATVQAPLTYMGAEYQAQQKEHEAQGQVHAAKAQEAQEVVTANEELQQKVRQTMADLVRSIGSLENTQAKGFA